MFKKDKWTLYAYFNGILIKKIKISKDEAPADNLYIINVWFKKQIFKSNKVNIIVRPTAIITNDEKNKKTYWQVELQDKGIRL